MILNNFWLVPAHVGSETKTVEGSNHLKRGVWRLSQRPPHGWMFVFHAAPSATPSSSQCQPWWVRAAAASAVRSAVSISLRRVCPAEGSGDPASVRARGGDSAEGIAGAVHRARAGSRPRRSKQCGRQHLWGACSANWSRRFWAARQPHGHVCCGAT